MAPDSHRKKRRLITAIFFFIAGILSASWSSRIPDVQQKLHLNDAAWGTVLVALPIGLVTGLFLSSWLVAKFGTAKIMVVSCLLASFALTLMGLANLRGQLMVVLFFSGFIRTVLNIAINTNSVEVQQLYNRPIVATFHGIWSVACFIAIGFGALMIIFDVVPFFHFVIIACFCIGIVLLYKNKVQTDVHVVPQKMPFLIKPDKYLWLLGAIAFCVMTGENTVFDWSVNYFETVVHAKKGVVTLGYTSFIVAMAFGRLSGDLLIHRYGHIHMLLINGILMSSGFILASFLPYLLPAAFGFLLIGLGDSIVVPMIYTLASRSSRMKPGYAITFVTLIGYTGFLIAPLFIGSVSQALGMQWAFGFVGLLAFGISLLTLGIRKLIVRNEVNLMNGSSSQ